MGSPSSTRPTSAQQPAPAMQPMTGQPAQIPAMQPMQAPAQPYAQYAPGQEPRQALTQAQQSQYANYDQAKGMQEAQQRLLQSRQMGFGQQPSPGQAAGYPVQAIGRPIGQPSMQPMPGVPTGQATARLPQMGFQPRGNDMGVALPPGMSGGPATAAGAPGGHVRGSFNGWGGDAMTSPLPQPGQHMVSAAGQSRVKGNPSAAIGQIAGLLGR